MALFCIVLKDDSVSVYTSRSESAMASELKNINLDSIDPVSTYVAPRDDVTRLENGWDICNP